MTTLWVVMRPPRRRLTPSSIEFFARVMRHDQLATEPAGRLAIADTDDQIERVDRVERTRRLARREDIAFRVCDREAAVDAVIHAQTCLGFDPL